MANTPQPDITPDALRDAIAAGRRAADQFVFLHTCPEAFPCGFAWITFRCRKNSKLAPVLLEAGFRWDDYDKRYIMSPYAWTNTQDMDFKEQICRAFVDAAEDVGAHFGVRSRID